MTPLLSREGAIFTGPCITWDSTRYANMGLNDLTPDDNGTSSSSTSKTSSSSDRHEDKVVIGKGEYKKVFSEERWERVQKVIRDEMGMNPNEVVNNLPAKEMYSIVHEAATMADGEKQPEDSEYVAERCAICGKAADEGAVVVEGLLVHTSHTAGQIESELANE